MENFNQVKEELKRLLHALCESKPKKFKTYAALAEYLGVATKTVYRWRKRVNDENEYGDEEYIPKGFFPSGDNYLKLLMANGEEP